MRTASRFLVCPVLLISLVLPRHLHGQMNQPGKIIGNLRVSRADFPDHPVPKMPQVYLQLVNLYVQQKRTAEAINQLEAYLKAFSDSPFSPKARDLLKRLQGETAASAKPQ
jgi:Tetratricopeptide repeat